MPSGKVNLVTLVVVLALVAGIFALIDIVPAYLDNFDVDEAVSVAVNTAPKGKSDEALVNQIISTTDHVGSHFGEDSFGNQAELPGLGLTPDNVTIERDTVANRIVIMVEYDRMMRLKPLQRLVRIHFAPKREGALPP